MLGSNEKDYIRTGKLRYVVRDFPAPERFHRNVVKAAQAAYCASQQEKYWEIHDRFFANQQALGPNDLLDHAQRVGLDTQRFQLCLESEESAERIRKEVEDGESLGLRGTPTFALGRIETNGSEVKVLKLLRGYGSYPLFKDSIDNLLSSQLE